MIEQNDALSEYNSRRDFAKTPEPPGKRGRKKTKTLRFLVQKHAARRLHYDLRLELDGVLKSWAVPRGPSVDPGDKRLAVRTEDHPLSYGDFEGVIPAEQYGGGTVMLWDRGTWEPLHDPEQGLRDGKLHFRVHGERMTGGWALVRMHPRGDKTPENWLLIKDRDTVAETLEPGKGDVLLEAHPASVKTGRTMKAIARGEDAKPQQILGGQSAPAKGQAGRSSTAGKSVAAIPPFRKPQLATLVSEAPDGEGWLNEVKFDGYRLLVATAAGEVRCYTRSGLDWSDRFPRLGDAFARLKCDSALIDGEVVAEGASGKSPFSALQRAIKEGGPMKFYAFDLLSLNAEDLAAEPLLERKKALSKLLRTLPRRSPIHFSEHVRGSGPRVFAEICKAGHEGIIAKKAHAPYAGSRNSDWLKIKCTKRQELVIGGYSPSTKRGRAFASLLVGTWENDRFVYRGRVGTGYSEEVLDTLGATLKASARKTMPFDHVPAAIARNARWVTPKLVAEVDFAELTDDGYIRHGAFLGLREDKEAKAVTIETAPKRTSPQQTPDSETTIAGVRISSPDRVVFPKQGVTKIDLARYYAVAGGRMLEFAANRPLSLVRCPQGRSAKCFYQKHASDGFPEAIRTLPIEESSGKTKDYLYVADVAGLVSAVQMGTLELHIWGSAIDRLERPDRMVFDLDPDESVHFSHVRDAAADLRRALEEIGLKSLPMVTGGKGVHVVVPLVRRAEWATVKAFAKAFAATLAEAEPDRFVATLSKAKRRGRIFIDWLRNERGATAIAPYSTRARAGAPVATPVTWGELAGLETANGFHIRNMVDRLHEPDPWAEAVGWKQSLTKSIQSAMGLQTKASSSRPQKR